MKVDIRGVYREEASSTLRRTSRELRKAISMIEDLEQVVGLAIALAQEASANQMLELQKLDHLQQKILGCADFLDALGDAMPPEWTIDAKGASRCVLLAELGAKLGDAEIPSDHPPAAAETYEVF
jgi:hypothetical protein